MNDFSSPRLRGASLRLPPPDGVKTYNITVRNIYPAGQYAVALAGEINHLVLYAIECAPGTKMLLDRRTAAN